MGWAGFKEALASCPSGGSVLAKEGEYVYGPEDMDEKRKFGFAALLISSPLHLFGDGKAVLKPSEALPFDEWGIPPRKNAYCLLSTCPRGTLDGLTIEAPRGADEGHWTLGVGIFRGAVRLQSCAISAPRISGGCRIALAAGGPDTKPANPNRCDSLRIRFVRRYRFRRGTLANICFN